MANVSKDLLVEQLKRYGLPDAENTAKAYNVFRDKTGKSPNVLLMPCEARNTVEVVWVYGMKVGYTNINHPVVGWVDV